ncbi:MAG TPA: hypothetical protein DEF51_27790 [Myxococcales bacterium]|nr:hypothetical protein [Myxococcales bacterium]
MGGLHDVRDRAGDVARRLHRRARLLFFFGDLLRRAVEPLSDLLGYLAEGVFGVGVLGHLRPLAVVAHRPSLPQSR